MNALVIANTQIRCDAAGRYCLNDLHQASGGTETSASKVVEVAAAAALIAAAAARRHAPGLPKSSRKCPDIPI